MEKKTEKTNLLRHHPRWTARDLTECALFLALIAVGARIQIPVPYLDYFTLQFFFVLLCGLWLGPQKGAMAVGGYVLLGLFGVPVFAGGGGLGYVLRPSFGYLLGFVGAAYVAGWLRRRLPEGKRGYGLATFGALLVTYGVGILYKYAVLRWYLATPTPLWVLFASCFPLDLPGDGVLCILAVFVMEKSKQYGLLRGERI